MRYQALLVMAMLSAGCTSGGLHRVELESVCSDAAPLQAFEGDSLSLMTLNAGHGRNSSLNQMMVSTERTYENLEKIADVLDGADVDVVALQEADGPSRWSGKFNHVEYLRDSTDLNCALLGRHSDSWLASYGTALLTRSTMLDSESVKFPANPPTTTKGFVMSEVAWDMGDGPVPITIVSVHLDFSRKSVRDKQVAIMIEALRDVETPIVLMGDINSRWEQKRSHVQQLVDGLGLLAYEPQSESLGTYKKSDGRRLDWILVSRDLRFIEYRVLPDTLSDHLAVYAEVAKAETSTAEVMGQ